MNSFKLNDGVLFVYDAEGSEIDKSPLIEYLEDDGNLISNLKANLLEYTNTHTHPEAKEKIRKMVSDKVSVVFKKAFEGKKELKENEFLKIEKTLYKEFKKIGEELYSDIDNLITKKLNKNVTGGDEMFKTLKEAKSFTAHLDALANEIESLDGVSNDMRKHLAYRIDRLADVIEKTAFDKEANGIGSGSWLYDSDEARYMSTMGGTGVLEGDSDESHYMKHFKGDDHKEVLERQETMEIKEGGPKKKQPSDNYNEADVARRLKATVQKVIESLGK